MKFYGQWDPPVDEVLYRNYFPDKMGGFFVECGAGDGIEENCCLFFEEQRGWKGINLEPSSVNYEKLIINRPNALNLHLGLGDRTCNAPFAMATGEPNGWSGFEISPERRQECLEAGCMLKDIEAEMTTYKKLIVKHVDLFVLDVEGYELKVIDGMAGSKILPDVICAEHPLVGLKPLWGALAGLGYHKDFVSYNNAFFSRETARRGIEWWGTTDVHED